MDKAVESLKTLAKKVFRVQCQPRSPTFPIHIEDGTLNRIRDLVTQDLSELQHDFEKSCADILNESEFSSILPRPNGETPMMRTIHEGSRVTPTSILRGLHSAASLQIYVLRKALSEEIFVNEVVENFSELRKAVRGEKIRAYTVTGIAGVSMSQRENVETPWGILVPAYPEHIDEGKRFFRAESTCMLVEAREFSMFFDFDDNPKIKLLSEPRRADKAEILFPLACALSSSDSKNPSAPIEIWSTFVPPILIGSSFSFWHNRPPIYTYLDLEKELDRFVNWSKIVAESHDEAVDVSAKRIVSSISHRRDASDKLIDAIMVWENLVGSHSEVTFRVSAALAKTLEKNPEARRVLRNKLAKIYQLRSAIVHGAKPSRNLDIQEASVMAVEVGLETMRAFYKMGKEWLAKTSDSRSEAILLDSL